MFSLVPLNSNLSFAATFYPIPQEDSVNGRNSHAYLPSSDGTTQKEREAFISEIAGYAVNANEKWGIPASAIIGMAILESGYGTTRTSQFANNIFGIKVWGVNPPNAWQLVGQPDEDFEMAISVLSNMGTDRLIFDETKRRDNWYRVFSSYEGAVNFLAGTLLLNSRYGFARNSYQQRMNDGWSVEDASRQYLFDIGNAGYNHLGGDYYRRTVGKIMGQWNLYQYDGGDHLRDIKGHWAESSIQFVAEQGWITGYSDRTYKPNNPLTRAQAATVMVNFLHLKPTDAMHSFHDVSQTFWARQSIILVAQNGVMNGTDQNWFSPNTSITRAQMVQILYNARQYRTPSSWTQSDFSDIPHGHWALTAIETMRSEGIINGYGDGTFRPNEPITRAQMAAILKKVYERQS